MIFRTFIVFFILLPPLFALDITNPFAPVSEKSLSKQVFFINQPIYKLNLKGILDSGKTALISGKNGRKKKVHLGDHIGNSSGRIILMNRERVVVLVKFRKDNKTVFKVEIIKRK